MRVLHVSQPCEGGVANAVGALVDDQLRRGWEVTVACPTAGLLPGDVGTLAPYASAAGARHVLWRARRAPSPRSLLEMARLARILRNEQYDVVHLHASKAGLAGRAVLRGRQTTIFQPHGWPFLAVTGALRRATKHWERLAALWAHAIVCVSEDELQLGRAERIAGSYVVIPNGIDLDRFSAATDADRLEARTRLGLDAAAPLVVCVGRLSREKGQDILLESWPGVLARLGSARLALVGSGRDERALRERAHESVLFAGERVDVPDWLAAADVVAVPSRHEGMALTMLEAMGRGRSVVATQVAGAREAISDEAGAVVPTSDTRALADALARRLLDPALARGEGSAARSRAERFHDVRVTTGAVAALYRVVIANR